MFFRLSIAHYLVFFVCIIIHFNGNAQKLKYGLELNYNTSFNDVYQRRNLNALNLFCIYTRHEAYGGFDVTNIKWKKHRLWGFESGYKYHFYRVDKRSNFYLDLNYQHSRFCEGCAEPVNYNFIPEDSSDACLAFNRVKSNVLTIMPGYEMFFTNWLSSSLSFGAGVNWGELNDPAFDLQSYINYPQLGKRSYSLHLFLIKISLRFTINPIR